MNQIKGVIDLATKHLKHRKVPGGIELYVDIKMLNNHETSRSNIPKRPWYHNGFDFNPLKKEMTGYIKDVFSK